MIFIKSRQVLPQNKALEVSFSKKAFFRSKKVNKGQKSQNRQKSQISEFMKRTQITRQSRQIIPQNEDFDISFLKKLVSGSKKVEGQDTRKKGKAVKFRT